ncbi:hypothetical protein FHW67_000894 [Herbaspirillum sp. Sphag1AN]|uniref:hypothetical protein n=1 Tax=unclassified Herbaspirillum TaxID=2624150 RepID=UPI00160BF92E|nr:MULTISPECIES: hypothetical protein [unclassified Herbaspirillum]MBB3211646.1 hypothetical protein [Herbaspirillum sp. Sphag1AN]MBB3245086.1 hypothetical protein [Herbaspirillum sp. Sphag64]
MDDQQLVSGEIIPDSYFYRLQAISLDGTAWGNPKVAIGLEFDATGTLVTFEPDFLSTLRPITEASQTVANFVFLETLPFPLTHGTNTIEKGLDGEQSRWKRDQGEARTARMHLKYREWKEKTTHSQVTAIFFDTAPLGFEHRLLEAIRFSTAVPASWVMLEYVQDGLVHFELSPYRPALNHLVDEPLQARENALDFFRLFDSYYVHSSENAKGEEFSQLSVAIGALFNLKGLAIGEISLVIGVTIEALLKEGFSELEEIDPEIIVEVEVVEDVINSLTTIREKSRGRMKGSMSGIKSIRARDKLEKLQKLGLVNQMELQHWKKLRNTSAHGSLRIDPQKWQQHLQRIFAVTTLAYKLTFLRIGYFGPYTDYGSPGWPTAWFPTKDDAQKLSRVTEELAQLPVADVKGKLYAWKAVETALRNTFPEGDVGALRASASLVLLAAMRKVGTLRLAELGSGN